MCIKSPLYHPRITTLSPLYHLYIIHPSITQDIPRFEDLLPACEQGLGVTIFCKIRLALQIRIFGGHDWPHSDSGLPVGGRAGDKGLSTKSTHPLKTTGQGTGTGAGSGLGLGTGLGKNKHVVFAPATHRTSTTTTATNSSSSSSSSASTHHTELPLNPRLQELLQPVPYPTHHPTYPTRPTGLGQGLGPGLGQRLGPGAGLAPGSRANPKAAYTPLFECSSPYDPLDPLSSKHKASMEKLKTREVEHMLDISAQGLTLAVRVYQPPSTVTALSADKHSHLPTSGGGKESGERPSSSQSSQSSSSSPSSSSPSLGVSSYPSQRLSVSAQVTTSHHPSSTPLILTFPSNTLSPR